MKKKPTPNETDVAAPSGALRPGWGLVNTTSSPYVRLRSVDMDDVQWTRGFWADKSDRCAQVMVPNLGFWPRYFAGDAAFDAWHIYQPFAEVGGMAAIPLNSIS